jgi:hypothetical protein
LRREAPQAAHEKLTSEKPCPALNTSCAFGMDDVR